MTQCVGGKLADAWRALPSSSLARLRSIAIGQLRAILAGLQWTCQGRGKRCCLQVGARLLDGCHPCGPLGPDRRLMLGGNPLRCPRWGLISLPGRLFFLCRARNLRQLPFGVPATPLIGPAAWRQYSLKNFLWVCWPLCLPWETAGIKRHQEPIQGRH